MSYFVHWSKDLMKGFLSRGTFRSIRSQCLTRRITKLRVSRIQDIEYLTEKEDLTSSDLLTMKTEVYQLCKISLFYVKTWRFQWPRGLRGRSAAARLMRFGFESRRGHGCLMWLLCVVRQRSLRRADHSSTRVLPTVVRRCVWSRNIVNEEALTQWGLLCQK